MSTLLYLLDTPASGSSHGTLQIGGSAPGVSTMATSWTLGTVFASNEFADMAYASNQASSAFSTTPGPSTGTGTTRCFRTATTLSGFYAAASWSLALAVLMTTPGTSGNGNFNVRMYRSTNATGSGATELTVSTESLSNFGIATATQQDTAASWTLTEFELNNEYLFLEIGIEIQSGAVNSSSAVAALVQDGSNSLMTAPNIQFYPTPSVFPDTVDW
jgi:hypothetical protein